MAEDSNDLFITKTALAHVLLLARSSHLVGPIFGEQVTFTKHGASNTEQLLKEAAGPGRQVGQWLDDVAAEQFIASRLDQLKNGAKNFDLPEGLGRVINPDGTFTPASKARLVPTGSGVKTAYPLVE